jgi:hypothetical protein
MKRGYIKTWRKVTEWGWFTTPNMFHLFQYLILAANIEDKEWRGEIIKRGQLATGLHTLHKNTGISIQSLRTCLDRLKSTNEITIKSTNRFSIITIIKYEEYQPSQEKSTNKSTNKLTNNQQTTNKQLTTTKEVKNVKNGKNTLSGADAPAGDPGEGSGDGQGTTPPFDWDEYLQSMFTNRDKHVRVVAQYFDMKKITMPNKKAAQSELRYWFKDASYIAQFPPEKILAAFDYVADQEFLEGKWTLKTVRKYITSI